MPDDPKNPAPPPAPPAAPAEEQPRSVISWELLRACARNPDFGEIEVEGVYWDDEEIYPGSDEPAESPAPPPKKPE